MSIMRALGRSIGNKILENHARGTAEVNEALATLNDAQKRQYEQRFQTNKKTLGKGYLMMMAGGLHYAYTEQWTKQIIFYCTFFGLLVWFIMDMFLMYFVVDTYNRKLSMRLINQIKAVQRSAPKVAPTQTPQRPSVTSGANGAAARS